MMRRIMRCAVNGEERPREWGIGNSAIGKRIPQPRTCQSRKPTSDLLTRPSRDEMAKGPKAKNVKLSTSTPSHFILTHTPSHSYTYRSYRSYTVTELALVLGSGTFTCTVLPSIIVINAKPLLLHRKLPLFSSPVHSITHHASNHRLARSWSRSRLNHTNAS